MRWSALALGIVVTVSGCGGDGDGGSLDGGGGGGGDGAREQAEGPCALLTDEEVVEIMGTEPSGAGVSEVDDGETVCNWGTNDPERLFYVFVRLESLDDVLGDRYPDYRTFLDESTNVEIVDVDDLGDEAYATKSPLLGAGLLDGLDVVVGDQVVELGWQSRDPVDRDAPRFDDVVAIMERVLDRL